MSCYIVYLEGEMQNHDVKLAKQTHYAVNIAL